MNPRVVADAPPLSVRLGCSPCVGRWVEASCQRSIAWLYSRRVLMKWRSHPIGFLALSALWLLALDGLAPATAAEAQPGRIKIEYAPPKDPKHKPLYDLLKQRRVLEQLQRLYSPLRLPTDLTIQTAGCDGIVNAWYERAGVTLCYELLDLISQPLPKDVTWADITREDAAVGQFLYIAGHEVAHAVFDLLKVPIFGNEEDAADQFSTYLVLRLGRDQARRLVSGAAYYFRRNLKDQNVTLKLKAFSSAHSRPQQRFYNLLCTAYGADSAVFADLVAKDYLPKDRADGCRREYSKVTNAFRTLIGPHIDPDLAGGVLDEVWLVPAPQ